MTAFHTDHATDQLWHRYQVEPTQFDWINAFLDIVDGRSVLLARQSNGRERHIVKVGDVAAIVVYNPQSAKIITALPPPYRSYGL